MGMRLYLIGICLILVGSLPIALTGYPGVFEFVVLALITLVVAVSLGAYLLLRGGLDEERRARGRGARGGRVFAYLIGLALLLPGTFITATVLHELVSAGLRPDGAYLATVVALIVGPLLLCAGIAVLVVAGRLHVGEDGGLRL